MDRGRTSSVAWLPNPSAGAADVANAVDAVDPVLIAVEERRCAMLNCRAECTEPFQVIHYEEGQQYEPHLDAYDSRTKVRA
eukprot:SAG31_NODE_18324_length_640_cov_1.024030_2_plen_80_part_01